MNYKYFPGIVLIAWASVGPIGCDGGEEQPVPADHACSTTLGICGSMAAVEAGATCVPVGDNYRCECPEGLAGTGNGGKCEDVNECNEFEVADLCGPNATSCSNTFGSFNCSCASGFATDGPGTECKAPTTGCEAGFAPTGLNGACEDVNKCTQNDLVTNCGALASSCTNSRGSFTCSCAAGAVSPGPGSPCQLADNNCDAGFAPTGLNGACQDINECNTDRVALCGVASAGCSNRQGTFDCSCPAGWSGQGTGKSCVDVDECAGDVAATCGVAGATCANLPGTFRCGCPLGYTAQSIGIVGGNGDGVKCVDINECLAEGFCDAFCFNTPGSAECVSTVADEDSPYWRYGCPTSDTRYIDNKTSFELDCRCSHTQIGRPDDPNHPDFNGMRRCNIVTDAGNYNIGTGPSVRRWRREMGADTGATRLNGGYLDATERKIYVGTQWKDNTATDGNPEFTYYGAILAVDVNWSSPTVGNRTLISGHTLEGDRGTGPTLRAVQDIKRGADGMLYTMSWESGHPTQIMRVDPATGNRTLVWISQEIVHPNPVPASQCTNGGVVGVDGVTNGGRRTLQITTTGQNMTITDNGDFLLGAVQNGPAKGPRGIVRISADGSTCTWVTRFAATNNNLYATKAAAAQGPDYGLANGTGPLGAGPNNFGQNPANLFYRKEADGSEWVYALDGMAVGANGIRYYKANLATGDRVSLFSAGIGDSHSVWDPMREVLWTTGGFDATRIVAVDILGHDGEEPSALGGLKCLSTTSQWYQCMRGPGDGDRQNRSGTFYDPVDGNLVIAHGVWGLVRVDVPTGNTYVISR